MAAEGLAQLGGSHRFVGRSREVEQVGSFMRSALVDGGALLVSGEPGSGRSTMLDLAAEIASSAGAILLRATGSELETGVPFAALDRVLASLRSEIGRLPPPYRGALSAALGLSDGAPSEGLVLGNAVLALLRLSARAGATVVVVDDLHRLDPASAAVMGFVARRLAGHAVAFIGAVGPEVEARSALAGLPVLALHPLDERSADSLVAKRFPEMAPTVRRRVIAEAQGNPLALIGLPASLTQAQRTADEPLPPVLHAPEALAKLVATRLDTLTPQARSLLLLAALEGSGELSVIARATDVPGGLGDLAGAERLGLVSEDSRAGFIRFRHPLVRAAVVDTATEIERRRAHRALAQALDDRPDRRVWHLAEATVGPDAEVADLLEQVGRGCLRRGDVPGAVGALARAAGLTPSHLDRGRRLVDAAYVCAATGGQAALASHFLEAAGASSREAADSLRAATVRAHLALGSSCDVERAHRLLVEAISRYRDRPDGNDEWLDDAWHSLVEVCSYAGRAELWKTLTDIASSVSSAPSFLVSTPFLDSAPRAGRTVQRVDAALATLHDEADPVVIDRVAIAALHTDRLSACRGPLWRVVRHARLRGPTALSVRSLLFVCLGDWFSGRWDEALSLSEEGDVLSQIEANRLSSEMLRGYVRPLILVARGRSGDAPESTERMARWAASGEVGLVTAAASHVRALSAAAQGNFDQAYVHASSVAPPGTLPRDTPHALWMLHDLVEAAVRTGRVAEAVAHVEAMRADGVASISPRLELVATGCAALAATGDEARDLYRQALAVAGAERWPFDLGRVLLAYGEHLRRARATEEANDRLLAAMDVFERLGARPWMTRAAEAVRAMGQPTARPVTTAPAELLTAQELEIAHLAASGLTNKQIADRLCLSHRTIGAHLYKVYPKLGVASRAALRDALGARA